MTEIQEQDRRDFIVELIAIKHRAIQLGMIKTFHAIDEATKVVGWELAEMLERDKK